MPYAQLLEESEKIRPSDTKIGRLSCDAIDYGTSLQIDDPRSLSARLYFFNRVPVSPSDRLALDSPAQVLTHLGLSGGEIARRLKHQWKLTTPEQGGVRQWFEWKNRACGRQGLPRYKVYVSPVVEALGWIFETIADVFGQVNAARFKVGADAFGLYRPDKIVGYFFDFEGVAECASRLRTALGGIEAHGVPFTASLDAEGLISWGIDPPRNEHLLSWQERESWRLWLTNRIALALIEYKSHRADDLAVFLCVHSSADRRY